MTGPRDTLPPAQRQAIEARLGSPLISCSPVSGGCINAGYRISVPDKPELFCKINSATKFPRLFEKEAEGLGLLARPNLVRTPAVIDRFESNDFQFLFLQWMNAGERTTAFWKNFGAGLAALHRTTAKSFGLDEDNYMGSIVQKNQPSASWSSFLAEQKLQPLVSKCADRNLLAGRHIKLFENLYRRTTDIFDSNTQPALLHGDLWNGNFICSQDSEPVLIDPAVYYGHPSMDLGMTTLFGGFHPAFYEAYHFHSPFPSNYEEQWQVCNLYPLLVHLLLFGRGYLQQIERTLQDFA